jgi:hypothetical protein
MNRFYKLHLNQVCAARNLSSSTILAYRLFAMKKTARSSKSNKGPLAKKGTPKRITAKTTKSSKSLAKSKAVVSETKLSASAKDKTQRKVYEQLFRDYSRDKSLIVPNEEDWLLASKVLYWLTQNRRRSGDGKLRKLQPRVSQRMALDAVLAVSARRWENNCSH